MYTHDGTKPVKLKSDPVDPNAIDWVYFIYDTWLTTGESISTHSVPVVEGGTIETDSTAVGPITLGGTEYQTVYAVQFGVAAGSSQVQITHRISTTRAGTVDLGRANIDHTVIIPVKTL